MSLYRGLHPVHAGDDLGASCARDPKHCPAGMDELCFLKTGKVFRFFAKPQRIKTVVTAN